MGQSWTHHLDKDTKRCSGCKEIKAVTEFPVNAARYDGLNNYCVLCIRVKAAESRKRLRIELLTFLGGKCVKCGFDDWRALEIDHVNSDGADDRREARGPGVLRRRVRANPERFQVLCSNHNTIKRYEAEENFGRRVYERAVLTERIIAPRQVPVQRTHYNPSRTRAAEEKARELAALVVQRRPLEKSPVRLPQGSWSRYYERCLACHETDRSHASDGCCYRCDKLIKGYNRRVSVFAPSPVAETTSPFEQAEVTAV